MEALNVLEPDGARRLEMDLKGKRVIALGERDGIQGDSIATVARSAGAEVVLEVTHCFV